MKPTDSIVKAEIAHPANGHQPYRDIRGVLGDPSGEISLREVWHLLLTHKHAIIGCLVVMVMLAIGVSLILPTRYEAVVRLTLNSDSQNALGLDDLQSMAMPGGADTLTKVETQVHILQTDSLAWDVINIPIVRPRSWPRSALTAAGASTAVMWMSRQARAASRPVQKRPCRLT